MFVSETRPITIFVSSVICFDDYIYKCVLFGLSVWPSLRIDMVIFLICVKTA